MNTCRISLDIRWWKSLANQFSITPVMNLLKINRLIYSCNTYSAVISFLKEKWQHERESVLSELWKPSYSVKCSFSSLRIISAVLYNSAELERTKWLLSQSYNQNRSTMFYNFPFIFFSVFKIIYVLVLVLVNENTFI